MLYKPRNIEAIQWDCHNLKEIKRFLPVNKIERSLENGYLFIHTPKGFLLIPPQNFIIKLKEFEVSTCTQESFHAVYQEANEYE